MNLDVLGRFPILLIRVQSIPCQTMSMSNENHHRNPFLELKFYEFAAVSALVIAFFPISLLVCWFAFGSQTTRYLVEAMIKDWIQTMIILVLVVLLLIGGVIWGVVQWLV